ncbi:hypothetical protein Ahy_A02g005160 isoform A [Arachis hypogaea]|uniref:Endonuclease/exonuclease/phosphatase domain-containing protein n=1 Tax=Arachis hypogaea TaxID=3818 RepID=A0A445E5W8_ARAHY|nr:hypothetical protein Ahy_A02g005160 isoform A [Arachis hypogaea]
MISNAEWNEDMLKEEAQDFKRSRVADGEDSVEANALSLIAMEGIQKVNEEDQEKKTNKVGGNGARKEKEENLVMMTAEWEPGGPIHAPTSAMIILSWNCRGVAASLTISELLNLCKQKKPSIIFLIETRAKDIKIKRIRRRLHFDKYFCVEPRDLSGGLCILWKDIVNINVYSWCDNYIKTKISDSKGNGWSCNFLYGNPIFRNRKRLWKMLTESNINPEEPQACLGDFNDILTQEEKIGLHPKPKNQVEEFENFVNTNCLMDLDLKGNKFTWFSNSRGDFITRKRLDRVLVNWRWREIFQHATLEALPAISSDHCPLVLNLNPVKKVNKYFRYEVFWDDHEECKEVIQKGWNMISAQRYNWNSFSQKIKHCKEDLKRWSRKTFARADLEIAKLKERLIGLQNSEFTEDQQYSIAQIRDKITSGQEINLQKSGISFGNAIPIQTRVGERIIKTPISLINKKDGLIWPYKENGEYTVKIGYHLARAEKIDQAQNQASSSTDLKELWKTIWGMHIP